MTALQNEENLLNALTTTNYQTKAQLIIKTGMCDRALRRSVENLRRLGHLIVSSDDKTTPGYKIANTQQEINIIKHLYKCRIKTELETLTAMFGSNDIESWLGQTCMIIRKVRREEINAALKKKKCVNCGQCNQFGGVCVYDIIESEGEQ